MYKVVLVPAAEKVYAKADGPLARKLERCFAQLERDPTDHPNIKRLSGTLVGYWRYRVGDYRVIYRIDDPADTAYVLKIAHRREAY